MTALVLLLFFLSGMSGLVYQVIWVREFGTIFGVSVYSAATVSAVFMLGLGVGSYWVGRWADRLYAQRRSATLRAYGLFELAIAALALLVALLLPYMEGISAGLSSYQQNAAGWYELSAWSLVLRAGVAIVLLLPITFLMGGTLTLLIRYLVTNELSLAGWRIGALYGVNTAGAAFGAFMTDFALVPGIGVFATELVAIVANAVAGLAALALAARDKATAKPSEGSDVQAPASASSRWPLFGMATALFCSGVASMGMEIVWFRYLISSLGGMRAVFSLLLTVILVGIFLGSLLGGWLERRTGRAAALYFGTQTLFVVTTIVAFLFYDPRTMGIVAPDQILAAAGELTGFSRSLVEASFSLQKVTLLAGLPAVLMGCTFPLANAHVQRIEASVGRQSGVLYLANTVGNVVGLAGTGLVLLPWLGVQRSTTVLMALVILGLLALYGSSLKDAPASVSSPRVSRRILFPCLALLVLTMFFWNRQPSMLLGSRTLPLFIVEQNAARTPDGARIRAISEGINETVAVVDMFGARSLFTNGHSMSAANEAGRRYMRLFAHLPLLNIEEPKASLVICFGVGNTLHATSLYDSMEHLEVAELSKNVLDHASYFSESNRDVLKDPRVRVHVNDGRQHLRMKPESFYDLVTLEPPPITFAGVASLYSREFYELAHSRLKDGGYLTQWLPGYQVSEENNLAIVKAFVDVFPGAVLISGYDRELILMGMKGGKTVLDIEQIRRSLTAAPGIRADLEAINIHSLVDLVGTFAGDYETLEGATASTPPVTDDNPIIEYETLAPLYDTKMPAEMFDLSDTRAWCPDCYEGDRLRDEFRGLALLQKALSIYFASDSFLQLSMAKGPPPFPPELGELLWEDPCVAATLRGNAYLSRVFENALIGVPVRPCQE